MNIVRKIVVVVLKKLMVLVCSSYLIDVLLVMVMSIYVNYDVWCWCCVLLC